jgi:uncharacterized repeat protein (TIGR01451 family)
MKKLFTLLALMLCLSNLKAQFVTIPDANFVTWLQANVASAMNGNQMDTTSLAVINRKVVSIQNLGINDVTGLQYFDSLKKLDCGSSNLLPNSNLITFLPSLPSTLDTLIFARQIVANMPILPNTLKLLDCSYTHITSIPVLPNSLEELDCKFNNLSILPVLPNGLKKLDCGNSLITNLPALPNTLTTLLCRSNPITSLPILPNSLMTLECLGNYLTGLPILPNSLESLDCSFNQITSLPNLPSSLLSLSCHYNQISTLPVLPNNLRLLWCGHNSLSNLPPLSDSLRYFDCNTNNISCFNSFSLLLSIVNISSNPFSCLPNYLPVMSSTMLAYPLCLAGNLNNCPTAKGIVGHVYSDNIINNCIRDAGDFNQNNIPLKIYNQSGTLLGNTYSASNGIFNFPQSSNTYSIVIDTTNLPFKAQCQYPGLDSNLTTSVLDTNLNFALTCKSGYDLGIQSVCNYGFAFPGMQHKVNIVGGDMSHWYNLNCANGASGQLQITVTGNVTYDSPEIGSLTPSVTGNLFTYNIPDFGMINNLTDFNLLFTTNTNAQSGDVVCVTATITTYAGDNNSSNNIYTYCYNVVNSYDPNIKETYPENVQPGFNDWLTYTIHFQNTGNAPAMNIRLLDTLDNVLDMETFQVINYSHPNLIDLTGNVLNVRFPNIQLPDSTSNSAGSTGFIQYRAKPKTSWVAPYQIKNTAYIYFDYNAPIVTNTTFNSILIPTGLHNQTETVMNLFPNPTSGIFTIELNTKEKQFIQVFDITGNAVLSHVIENGKATIDGNNLAAGIYNICIKGSSSVTNKKLVIVK